MNELSLFTGAGGGLLATQHLLGFRTIAYVEINEHCQKTIAQRIRDGLLDNAPIYVDIRTFINSGRCDLFKRITDVITAGFPCQPWSVAGRRKGETDERNLWPETRDTIGIVRPRYVFLENVPGLLGSEYAWTILSDIAALGYDCAWGIVAAADVGAPHLRKRWWLVAHAPNLRLCKSASSTPQKGQTDSQSEDEGFISGGSEGRSANVAHAEQDKLWDESGRSGRTGWQNQAEFGNYSEKESMAHAAIKGLEKSETDSQQDGLFPIKRGGQEIPYTEREHDYFCGLGTGQIRGQRPKKTNLSTSAPRNEWWAAEPRLGRVAHGVAHRVDRLKALGEGQVPAVAALAWRLLSGEMEIIEE